jgi:hypothetical protein
MGKEGKHVNVWRSYNKSISTPHLIEIWKQEDKRKWQAFSTDHRLLVGSCFCQQAEHWSVNSSPRTEQQVIVSDFQCFVWCFLQIFGWTLLYCIIWSKLAIAMIICLSVSLAVWYSFFFFFWCVCVCVKKHWWCNRGWRVGSRLRDLLQGLAGPRWFGPFSLLTIIIMFMIRSGANHDYRCCRRVNIISHIVLLTLLKKI